MKRLAKCGISLMVFAFMAIRSFLIRLFGGTPKGTCVILYYHSIPADQRARFAKQLDVLLRCATPANVTGDMELSPGSQLAVITFDDGFENFYENALPELKKRRIPSVMFVITDALGKAFGPVGHSEKVMSLERIRSLPEELVTVGSHTLTHPFLPAISEEEARQQITVSRTKLEESLNRRIDLFSFPFGGFNQRLVEICKEAGYSRIFTTLPAFAFEEANEFVVPRVRVDPTDWPAEFRLKLAGAYGWLPIAFRIKRFIVPDRLARNVSGASGEKLQRPESQSTIQDLSIQ
jgi:peptidoglycan/xylan/chitin deacetylase (PgdA/CDA1 family)